ncbi:MAG: PIN domain nuclease [Hyphomonadaceae bacterium]
MIVVDTSAWIAYFRNEASPAAAALRALQWPGEILVGDLVLLECLQGARDENHAARIEAGLRAFTVEPMLGPDLAAEAARHYRTLRAIGATPRKTIDLIIATFCIARGHVLLHQDRDFEPMIQHLGLQAAL